MITRVSKNEIQKRNAHRVWKNGMHAFVGISFFRNTHKFLVSFVSVCAITFWWKNEQGFMNM